jgi:hypothetical protein
MSSSGLRTLGIILLVLGFILLVVGIVYLTVPVDRLPSILGHAASSRHHTKRGWGGFLVGLALVIAGGITLGRSRETGS